MMERLLRKCRIQNQLVRECMAECLGVYIMILFGCGAVAQVVTTEDKKGQYLSINLGFALGTCFGVFVSRGVSGAHLGPAVSLSLCLLLFVGPGAHLNPAVSLSLCFLGRHPWTKFPFYVFFQVLGAFLAAATVGLQYYEAILSFGGGQLLVTGPTATAGIFSTYPAAYLSLWGGFVDQVIGTAALLVCVLALGDAKNSPAPPGSEPVLVGAAVLVIGVSMGSNSGYALNPARDIGPRLFTYVAGWGAEVFQAGGGWWWVPLVATCMGALLGTVIYELFIEVHHPASPAELHALDQGVPTVTKALELEGVELDSDKPMNNNGTL